jgi:hypothetical protein
MFSVDASRINASQILSVDSLDVLKVFATETPLNSATILAGKPYVRSVRQ